MSFKRASEKHSTLLVRISMCWLLMSSFLALFVKPQEVSLTAHWKFAVFWHMARDVVIQDSGRSPRLGEVRTLDRYGVV